MIHRRQFLAASLPVVLAGSRLDTWASDALGYSLFDGHAHLVADDAQKYPRSGGGNPPTGAPGSLPAGVGGQPGGSAVWTERADMDAARVIPWMDQQGVSRLAAVQKKGTYGFDNSYILDSCDRFPDRLCPVVVLDAEAAETPDKISAWVRQHGLAGVRLTGGVSDAHTLPWLNSANALRTWQVLQDHALVADLMITALNRPPEGIHALTDLAQRFPSVRLVLDHLAYPIVTRGGDYGVDRVHASLARYKNIFMKITSINLDLLREGGVPANDFIRRVVDVYGSKQVLWGTDAGNSAGTYAQLVERMLASTTGLNAVERRDVLRETGNAVFVRGGRRLTP